MGPDVCTNFTTFMVVLKIMGKKQPLELTWRKILAAAFNYSLVLDSGSVYFYVENPHFLLPHGCFCQLCVSVTNKCTLNESLEQEFGDLIHCSFCS